MVSMSVYEDRASAEASTEKASAWVAENAAELSAENMGANTVSTADYDNGQGHMHAKMTRESPATTGALPGGALMKVTRLA